MKKTLIALAVLGSIAGVAQAQSNVTIYGVLDAGITKSTGSTTQLNSGDNNRIGFKGVEDLGCGLKATFQIEQRFDIDTGTTEGAGTRPLFQGRTTVGLAGAFGSIKLGRDLTAMQQTAVAFDPWGATRARGAFIPDVDNAGYASGPDAAQNRFSNAAFYNSPVMSGFQANVSVATKEAVVRNQLTGVTDTPSVVPTSFSGTYNNGPIAGALSYERNGHEDKFWSLAGSYAFGPANLMATYAQTKFGDTGLSNGPADSKTKAWSIGARVVAGPGNLLVGYGQLKPDNTNNTKKFAIGYEYNLSKRTYLYTDAISRKVPHFETVNTFDVGLHHSF